MKNLFHVFQTQKERLTLLVCVVECARRTWRTIEWKKFISVFTIANTKIDCAGVCRMCTENMEYVRTGHFTICQKPFECNVGVSEAPLCQHLHEHWWTVRDHVAQLNNVSKAAPSLSVCVCVPLECNVGVSEAPLCHHLHEHWWTVRDHVAQLTLSFSLSLCLSVLTSLSFSVCVLSFSSHLAGIV